MTKKHFRELAESLYRVRPRFVGTCPDCDCSYDEWTTAVSGECFSCHSHAIQSNHLWHEFIAREAAWRDAVNAVAYSCRRFNSAFDNGRFVTACEEGL
jgi:hypothetical protein